MRVTALFLVYVAACDGLNTHAQLPKQVATGEQVHGSTSTNEASSDATDDGGVESTSQSTTTALRLDLPHDTCSVGAEGCPCTDGDGCDPGLECGADRVCVADATTTGDAVGNLSSSVTSEPSTETATDSGAPDPDPEYAAAYLYGGLDRLYVRRADAVGDLCVEVVFAWPGEAVVLEVAAGVAVPGEWRVESARAWSGAVGCLEYAVPGFVSAPQDVIQTQATAVSGSATWAPDYGCPPTLDVDLVVTVDGAGVAMQAVGVVEPWC